MTKQEMMQFILKAMVERANQDLQFKFDMLERMGMLETEKSYEILEMLFREIGKLGEKK